jgi:hypothetical protein
MSLAFSLCLQTLETYNQPANAIACGYQSAADAAASFF